MGPQFKKGSAIVVGRRNHESMGAEVHIQITTVCVCAIYKCHILTLYTGA